MLRLARHLVAAAKAKNEVVGSLLKQAVIHIVPSLELDLFIPDSLSEDCELKGSPSGGIGQLLTSEHSAGSSGSNGKAVLDKMLRETRYNLIISVDGGGLSVRLVSFFPSNNRLKEFLE